MIPSPIALLEETLGTWQQWQPALTSRPTLQATLSAGRSHCSFLVVSNNVFFVVRIESEASRALAMKREQEFVLLKALNQFSPNFVWADEYALVTEYTRGRHWIAPHSLPNLVAQVHQLHQQKQPIEAFNLLDHADGYWQKLPSSTRLEHQDFFTKQRRHLQLTLQRHPEQCLCHNDLIPENIIQHDDNFTFIDWEYAAYNSPYFDLATLVEFAPLTLGQQQEVSRQYWSSDDQKHLTALNEFRQVVRFIEWLWELLQAPQKATSVKHRLEKMSA